MYKTTYVPSNFGLLFLKRKLWVCLKNPSFEGGNGAPLKGKGTRSSSYLKTNFHLLSFSVYIALTRLTEVIAAYYSDLVLLNF